MELVYQAHWEEAYGCILRCPDIIGNEFLHGIFFIAIKIHLTIS